MTSVHKHKLTAVLVIFACAGLVSAAPTPVQADSSSTMGASAEMGQEADKADAAMNAAYKKLMALLAPEQKKRLVKAQKAWLAFRDAEVNFLSYREIHGTGDDYFYQQAVRDVTERRTRDLEQNYSSLTRR